MLKLFIFFIIFINSVSIQIEDRSGIEWTYRPTVNYTCDFIGCCGNIHYQCSPEYWIYLNPTTFERCQKKQQSPINIEINEQFIEFDYPIIFKDILCNGTVILRNNTWEIDFLEDKKCSVNTFMNTTWFLNNFHLHSAEHSINGEYRPLEIHYVHKDKDHNIMVISILVSGTSKSYNYPLLQNFEINNNNVTLFNINPYSIIDKDPSYWYYRGSLTTPPCQTNDNNDVQWFILKDDLEVNHNQIYFFTDYLKNISKSYNGHISRPTQEIHQNTQIFSYK
jgi:carbonic anhydrase